MTEKDAHDAKQMRMLLETEALKLSFDHISEGELHQLNQQVKQAEAKQNTDVWEVWEDNEEFHFLMASFSGNKVLMKLLKDCMGILQRIYAQQRRCIEARDYAGTMDLLQKDIEGYSEEKE